MDEHTEPKVERETRTHLFHLLRLILFGIVLYSLAAVAGLALAKRNIESGSGASSPSSKAAEEGASKPDGAL